ncbi:MAG TPA: sialate O-acetylesterase [Fimbriimonas sp.]|nr:sialate O-acetylesterase [Fimbriimonas sp.]
MILLLAVAALAQTTLQLNSLFSDSMVLQRGIADPVFGYATPGAYVSIQIAGERVGCTADRNGRWRTLLTPLQAGGPYEMTVSSGTESITVKDILVGEVWLASGQSNMEFLEENADDYGMAMGEATQDIRMFTVKHKASIAPDKDVTGVWTPAGAGTVGRFSAVAYSFARELNHKLGVPVGIINSCWGGTFAESWTSQDMLLKDPATKPIIDQFLADLPTYASRRSAYDDAMEIWMNGKKGGENVGFGNGWPLHEYNDSDWKEVPACSTVESIMGREFEGSFWYRLTLNVPDEWFGKRLKLELGALDDYDITYFNGIRIGRTDQSVAEPATVNRVYTIAPGIVRRGSNTIAVRVFNAEGSGGMDGPLAAMRLSLADGSASIPLSANWKFKVEQEIDQSAPRPKLPSGPGNPYSPSELYNGMIAPLIPYGIKGAIWYQGESNVGNATVYAPLFEDLIRDWRNRWGEGPLPFYFVQLPNFLPQKDVPSDSAWAELREAQAKALSLPHTGMAVTIDVGEADTIHPKNKREVGRRLSLWALSQTYGKPFLYASPAFQSMKIQGSQVTITFTNGSLMTTDNKAPACFAVAGEDKKFYWAETSVYGSTVTLSSPSVPHPVAVRYAWADNPPVNLTNRAGLPACPFRTDDWSAAGATK